MNLQSKTYLSIKTYVLLLWLVLFKQSKIFSFWRFSEVSRGFEFATDLIKVWPSNRIIYGLKKRLNDWNRSLKNLGSGSNPGKAGIRIEIFNYNNSITIKNVYSDWIKLSFNKSLYINRIKNIRVRNFDSKMFALKFQFITLEKTHVKIWCRKLKFVQFKINFTGTSSLIVTFLINFRLDFENARHWLMADIKINII